MLCAGMCDIFLLYGSSDILLSVMLSCVEAASDGADGVFDHFELQMWGEAYTLRCVGHVGPITGMIDGDVAVTCVTGKSSEVNRISCGGVALSFISTEVRRSLGFA